VRHMFDGHHWALGGRYPAGLLRGVRCHRKAAHLYIQAARVNIFILNTGRRSKLLCAQSRRTVTLLTHSDC
jgi:hypothetical protein